MFDPSEPLDGAPRSDLLARAGLASIPKAAVIGAAVLAVLALGVVGWRLGGASGSEEFVFEEGVAATEDPTEGGKDAVPREQDEPASLWVHVAGAVGRPGLYELADGARVGDALAAAGGARPEAAVDAVNLARPLADGEQVYVPTIEERDAGLTPPAAATEGLTDGGVSGAGIDINHASAAELEELPGVGPATAKKIVDDREANGPFASPEDLMRVSGIGEKKFEAMRELVVVR